MTLDVIREVRASGALSRAVSTLAIVFIAVAVAVAPLSVAGAEEHETISVTPAEGPCNGQIRIDGARFAPGSELAVLLQSGRGDFAELRRLRADQSGQFSLTLSPFPIGVDCQEETVVFRAAVLSAGSIERLLPARGIFRPIRTATSPVPPAAGHGALTGTTGGEPAIMVAAALLTLLFTLSARRLALSGR